MAIIGDVLIEGHSMLVRLLLRSSLSLTLSGLAASTSQSLRMESWILSIVDLNRVLSTVGWTSSSIKRLLIIIGRRTLISWIYHLSTLFAVV